MSWLFDDEEECVINNSKENKANRELEWFKCGLVGICFVLIFLSGLVICELVGGMPYE